MDLRPYQINCVNGVYDRFKSGYKSVLLYAPTGAGKTAVASKIMADCVKKGKRVLFLCHRKALINQTKETMRRMGIASFGVIASGHTPDYGHPLQIAMIQTLAKRLEDNKLELPKDIRLVVADECHLSTSFDVYREIVKRYGGPITKLGECFFLGLTATPWKTKRTEGFCSLFEATVNAPPMVELINKGFLTKPRFFSYDYQGMLSGLEVDKSGDYTEKSVAKVCGDPQFLNDVVQKYLEICPDKRAIVFSPNVKSCKALSDLFIEKGVKARYVVGNTPDADRERIFNETKTGTNKVIVGVTALTEGFDLPEIEAVLIARPTRSPAMVMQMMGRGLRLANGKDHAYILDFGGSLDFVINKRFKTDNFPTPIHVNKPSLCPRPLLIDSMMTKTCDACQEEIPIFAQRCPHCGNEFTKLKDTKDKTIEYPGFVELYTTAQKGQRSELRKAIARCFRSRKSPAEVLNNYVTKYNETPRPNDSIGSIFDLKNPYLQASLYHWHLSKITPKLSQSSIDFYIGLEFGKPGEKYDSIKPGYVGVDPALVNKNFNPLYYLGFIGYMQERHDRGYLLSIIEDDYKAHLTGTIDQDIIKSYGPTDPWTVNYCYNLAKKMLKDAQGNQDGEVYVHSDGYMI